MPQMRMSLSGCNSTERISASAALPPPTMTARRSILPLRAQRRIICDITSLSANSSTKPVTNQLPNHMREKSDETFMKKPVSASTAKVPDHTSSRRPDFCTGRSSAEIW